MEELAFQRKNLSV